MDDIRWMQRLDNYTRALKQLNSAVELSNSRELSELEQQGVIQSFEYTHELSWKLLKDFFTHKGNMEIYDSRDATKEAFSYGLIKSGNIWMDMIKHRNMTSHTYNRDTAKSIVNLVTKIYITEFNFLLSKMNSIKYSDK